AQGLGTEISANSQRLHQRDLQAVCRVGQGQAAVDAEVGDPQVCHCRESRAGDSQPDNGFQGQGQGLQPVRLAGVQHLRQRQGARQGQAAAGIGQQLAKVAVGGWEEGAQLLQVSGERGGKPQVRRPPGIPISCVQAGGGGDRGPVALAEGDLQVRQPVQTAVFEGKVDCGQLAGFQRLKLQAEGAAEGLAGAVAAQVRTPGADLQGRGRQAQAQGLGVDLLKGKLQGSDVPQQSGDG